MFTLVVMYYKLCCEKDQPLSCFIARTISWIDAIISDYESHSTKSQEISNMASSMTDASSSSRTRRPSLDT